MTHNSCCVAQAFARAHWGAGAISSAANSSSTLGDGSSHPWLASWTDDGGYETRLDDLGLCCFWVVHGLLLLALANLALRRCLCPHPLHLICSAGIDGNVSAGITDSVAILAAGVIVSGALPPRAQSKTEPPLSFVEQNIAASIAILCMVGALVIFSFVLNVIHFEGRSVDAFVTEKVQERYRLPLGGPILGAQRLKRGNPVKALLYGACLISYSKILGKAAAASVELLHLAVWAGAGCLVLLLIVAVLAKHLSSGFSTKHSFKKMAEQHNWGYGLVVSAMILASGLAIAGLIPRRGCGASTAYTAANVASDVHQNRTVDTPLFDLPSELVVLEQESLQTEQGAAVFTPDTGVALLLALLCVLTTRTFYQLPLRCISSAKKKRHGKKTKSCNDVCGFRSALQVVGSVTNGSLHAVSISFAGYTVAMGNILAATLGPAPRVTPLGPRLSAALHNTSGAKTEAIVLNWQNASSSLVELWVTAMPQLAWTGLSCAMMVVAHHVHLAVISWHLPDSDSDDEDHDGSTGVRLKAVERLRNDDRAYGVMEAGMHIVSSLVIAAGCAGRGLAPREVAGGWLCFAVGELLVCIFGAVTALRERRRRSGPVSASDNDGRCCGFSMRCGKRSKAEKREAKRRRELMLRASHAPGPGQSVGQSLNWCLHLIAWVLLLMDAYRSSRTSCGVQGPADEPLLPTLDEALPLCIWAVLGSAVLLSAQRIVMELVLSDVSDSYYKELERAAVERDPEEVTEDSVENWGAGLVGGTVSVGMSVVLVGLLPPPACA
eukprot:COSAG02_NODE_1_length_108762_cov_456.708287_70_plen_778_part_00